MLIHSNMFEFNYATVCLTPSTSRIILIVRHNKQLVDLLFIFPDEWAMDVQRQLASNGIY